MLSFWQLCSPALLCPCSAGKVVNAPRRWHITLRGRAGGGSMLPWQVSSDLNFHEMLGTSGRRESSEQKGGGRQREGDKEWRHRLCALKEVFGEALVAPCQDGSVNSTTSGIGTFLRSHTTERRWGWNTGPILQQLALCSRLCSQLGRYWAAPLLGPHPVSRSQDHSTGLKKAFKANQIFP